MAELPQTLDPTVLSEETQKFQSRLLSKIIGQPRAVKEFVRVFQQIESGINKKNRPAGVFLFMGPTGVGKTELVRAAAEYLLGTKDAITRIDCGEFQHSHETSKLLGSPPGYVGFDDKKTGSARLSQKNIDQFQTPKHKINFVLFDEIEESHETVFSAILQIMDAGRLTLGNNDTVDFTKTILVLTSNLGEKETQVLLEGKGIGLKPDNVVVQEKTDEKIYAASKAAARRFFKSKFMNRIDRLVVFRSLNRESLKRILRIEMGDLELRVWSKNWAGWDSKSPVPERFQVSFKLTEAAEEFLLKEGTDPKFGARELNRAIERFVSFPLGALIGSKQIEHGDVLSIDITADAKDLSFIKTEHRDLKHTPALPARNLKHTPALPAQSNGTPPISPPIQDYKSAWMDQWKASERCQHGKPKNLCLECNPPSPVPTDGFRKPYGW